LAIARKGKSLPGHQKKTLKCKKSQLHPEERKMIIGKMQTEKRLKAKPPQQRAEKGKGKTQNH
jgi:hypothetical protein